MLAIDLAAVADLDHQYHQRLVFDLVDDAGSHPRAPDNKCRSFLAEPLRQEVEGFQLNGQYVH